MVLEVYVTLTVDVYFKLKCNRGPLDWHLHEVLKITEKTHLRSFFSTQFLNKIEYPAAITCFKKAVCKVPSQAQHGLDISSF